MTAHAALDPAALDSVDRAAVMVMLLDDGQASAILGQLEPHELQRLGERMLALGDIGPEAITHSIAHFVEHTEALGMSGHGRADRVRSLMTQAVGEVRADNLMERIQPPPETAPKMVELARWLNPAALVPLVKGEHPQAIAVLLVQLEAEVAAEVLHSLTPEEQTQVVHRVATMGPIRPEAVAMLDELLERKLTDSPAGAALRLGGPREAADILNQAGKVAEKRIMPELNRMDKALARSIENEMFKFEHLYVLEPQAMGSLLREVDSDTLIDALKGILEEDRECFFKAMSSRAADGVRDEIAGRGRLKMAQCVEAQRLIVAAARRLSAEGVIVFGAGGGGEDEYV